MLHLKMNQEREQSAQDDYDGQNGQLLKIPYLYGFQNLRRHFELQAECQTVGQLVTPTVSREIARQTGRTAWQNVIFALAVKFAVMVLGLLGHASMWMAVFADSGVAMLCVLNSIRLLYRKK